MPKLVPTDPPSQVTTAEERGQMLRHLISRTNKSVPTFAKEAGLSRQTLSAILKGTNDANSAELKTARAILLALGLKDSEVHDLLNLSAEARLNWTTLRPPPYGSGTAPDYQQEQDVRLSAPMMGEVVLPAGAVITVDAGQLELGVQVVRLASGELFAMKAGLAAQNAGTVIGRLLRADFSAVL